MFELLFFLVGTFMFVKLFKLAGRALVWTLKSMTGTLPVRAMCEPTTSVSNRPKPHLTLNSIQ